MTIVEHGFLLSKIRNMIESKAWEPSPYDDGYQFRSVWLGSILSLTPSGKFYTPFVCSNVMGCDSCKNKGYHPSHKSRRVAKRRTSRFLALRATFEARKRQNEPSARRWLANRKGAKLWKSSGPDCTACNGQGSREAYLDQLWRESAESGLASIGCYLDSGEGDGCDVFAIQSREVIDEDGN